MFSDPYELDYQHEKHVVVTGSLNLKNTDGYLSADLQYFKGIYLYFTICYAIFIGFWYHLLKKNSDKVINLQKILMAVLIASFFECLMNTLFYFHINNQNIKSGFLSVLIVMMEVARSTFSRILVLFVALGY
jgi:hypothetical protein